MIDPIYSNSPLRLRYIILQKIHTVYLHPVSTKTGKKIFGPDFFSVESQQNNQIKIISAGGLVSGVTSQRPRLHESKKNA